MSPKAPSIQSFFQPEIPTQTSPKASTASQAKVGDGFTASEVEATLHPLMRKWQPRTVYNEVNIGDLVAGPGSVTVTGRVVNLYAQAMTSKVPQAAKGCLKLVVRDNSGAFNVKLWYAKMDYALLLGHLVSIWTPHVSEVKPDSSSLTPQASSLVTSIFPERDKSCYFMVQDSSDEGVLCKTPLGYEDNKQLAGLITLKNYINGGHEVHDAKILVCVKSIGGRKRFTTKKGNEVEKADVNVFDDTASATLTLWGCTAPSAASWKASYTILLLSRPGFRNEGRPEILLNADTHVDVDPLMTDAYWLRGLAEKLTKREHVNPPFPEGVFDIEAATTSETRIKFTLADLDEFVRASPTSTPTGYLSLIIHSLNIVSLHARNKFLSASCCGNPLYANVTTATCPRCAQPVDLRLNPRLLGTLLDSTGALHPPSLFLSDTAWTQLLGRSAAELAEADAVLLRYLEQRLLFLRVWVLVAWMGEGDGNGGGRLWGVRVGIV